MTADDHFKPINTRVLFEGLQASTRSRGGKRIPFSETVAFLNELDLERAIREDDERGEELRVALLEATGITASELVEAVNSPNEDKVLFYDEEDS